MPSRHLELRVVFLVVNVLVSLALNPLEFFSPSHFMETRRNLNEASNELSRTCNITLNGSVVLQGTMQPFCTLRAQTIVKGSLVIDGKINTPKQFSVKRGPGLMGSMFYVQKENSLRLNNVELHAGTSLSTYELAENLEGRGAAVVVEGVGAFLAAKNCTFSGHVAHGLLPYGSGGAIFATDNALVVLQNTSFIKNFAESSGGAIYVQSSSTLEAVNCVFLWNRVGFQGGSIASIDFGRITLLNCTILNSSSAYEGGGIHSSSNSKIELSNSVLEYNRALEGCGGGLFIGKNSSGTISDTIISYNSANDHGGGIFIEGSYIIFSRSNITRNKAVLYSGAGLYVGERAHVIYASGTIRNNSVQKSHQNSKNFWWKVLHSSICSIRTQTW